MPICFNLHSAWKGLPACLLLSSSAVFASPVANPPPALPYGLKSAAFDQATTAQALVFRDGVLGPTLRWGRSLDGDFTLAAWIWIDASVNPDEKPNKPTALWELRNDTNEDRLALQWNGRTWPELVFSQVSPNRTRVIRGMAPVVEGRWNHFAVIRSGENLELLINGEPFAIARLELGGGWNAFTVGRAGPRTPLVGQAAQPVVFDRALSAQSITRLVQSAGRYVSGEQAAAAPNPATLKSGYPELQVVATEDHPLIMVENHLHHSTMVAPWTAPGAHDLVVSSRDAKFSTSRLIVYSEVARDDRGLPVYDSGTPTPLLPGKEHQLVRQSTPSDQTDPFDVYALGEDTPYGGGALVRYRMTGRQDHQPQFASAEPIMVDNRQLNEAAGGNPGAFYIGDLDHDNVPDLLISVSVRTKNALGYWPDGGRAPWDGKDRELVGRGRGYDAKGEWLGEKSNTELRWAKGTVHGDNTLSFGSLETIYERLPDYPWRWRSWTSDRALATFTEDGQTWIVVTGSENEIMAARVRFTDGRMVCDQAIPLLADGRRDLQDTYFPDKINVIDLTGNGHPELVIDGNPGRIVVLQGSMVGEFREAGSLSMRGGPIAADTLTTPARADWNGDHQPDLITGDASGRLILWRGTEDPLVYHSGEPMRALPDGKPVIHRAGESGSIQGPGERIWGYLQPTVGDWRDDGTLSLITNDIRGEIMLYAPTTDPLVLEAPVLFTYEGRPLPSAWRSRPDILPAKFNFNQSQRPGLLYQDWDGELAVAIPQRVGSTAMERLIKLRYEDGHTIKLCGDGGLWGRAKLAVVDWTGDGRWDVLFGTNGTNHPYFFDHPKNAYAEGATPFLLENIGTNEQPVFRRPRPLTLPDGSWIDTGKHNASVWPADLNADGTPDLLIGTENGRIYHFLHTELK